MDKTIENIIDIDKRTQEIVDMTEKEEVRLKTELRGKLSDMENIANEEAKVRAKEEFDSIIKKFKKETLRRREENEKELKKIDRTYDAKEAHLIQRAFEKFILNKDE